MNPLLAADRGTIPVRALRWLGRAGSVISIGMLIYFSASGGGVARPRHPAFEAGRGHDAS